ncbi:hypothetical protein C8Q75DRAFT_783254 [Abortiporus biennis]|nr:hypothetical protein C8Q75DRAFT_783254 [Abortiporus biennis]
MGNLSGMKLVFLLVYWKHLALGRSDELRISYMRLMQSPVSPSKKLGCRKFGIFTHPYHRRRMVCTRGGKPQPNRMSTCWFRRYLQSSLRNDLRHGR